MSGLRVLWLSPWMRPLARVHAQALRELGHEVLLVTSDQHPESDAAQAGELVLDPRPKNPRTWAQLGPALARVRSFRAEVTVSELVRDPRWLAFGRGTPLVTVVHDDRPHDAGELRPRWERVLFDRQAASSVATVAFSRYVAEAISGTVTGPVRVVPLTSDLAEEYAPAPAPAEQRRDLVVVGRLNDYKNLAVTFEAWQRHVSTDAWRGDELVLIGAGEVPGPLPAHTRWQQGGFSYADVLPILQRAKASIVHYQRASQSGVQVLSMQLGVTPVVSPLGALREFQPPGETAIGVSDVAGLSAAMDQLADPVQAALRGARARAHYEQNFTAAAAGRRWADLLTSVTR